MHPQAHGRAQQLTDEIRALTGSNPAACYQCGKCSAGCPMAAEMPLKPHQMLRLVQLDKRERLLADESIWLCLTCETCSARCPNKVDPARIIDGVRELSFRQGAAGAPKHIRAFHKAFLDQIRSHGRVFELGLVAGYKLRSGALLADAASAPGMIARGKLTFVPTTIKGVDDVRRIFDACREASQEERG